MGSLLLSSVCALQNWSLFPPVLWKPYNQSLLAFSTRFPRNSQSLCWISRLGSLKWCSELSQQCENFFGIIVLQSMGHSPGRYEIWFYGDCTPAIILQPLLLCLWTWDIFFWWVPVSSCCWLVVQQLVAILVLSQEEITTCPSTLPSWTRSRQA